VTAVGSLVLLAGLVAGLPAALFVLRGDPLPERMPSPEGIWEALSSPDDGTLFLDVLTWVGWLAWASFTISVLLELVARVTRRPALRVPGLRGQQRVAAVLIAAIAALAVTPTVASASAAVVQAPPAVTLTTPLDPGQRPDTGRLPTAGTDSVLHLVERGQGLLDVQDRYGVPWQRIAEANFGVTQPDGRQLHQGQTRIYPGWQLRIPLSRATPAASDADTAVITGLGRAAPGGGGGQVAAPGEYEVARGDWMWHIADRYLGDPERFRDIAALNPEYADRHGDFPDHIEPGWTLRLPDDAVDRGPGEHARGTAPPAAAEPAPPPATAREPEPAEVDEEPTGQAEAPAVAPPGDPGEAAPPGQAGTAPPGQAEAAPPGQAGAAPPDAPGQVGEPAGAGAPPAGRVAPPPGAAPAGQAVPPPGAATPPAGPTSPGEASGPVTGFGPADTADDRFTPAAEPDLERLAPATLAGAGLLTALVLGAATLHQRRRHQYHRPGFRFASPAARRLEKALRAAQQPLDTARLDAALRCLAAGLAARVGQLPDVAGALVDDGSVHLLLAAPCPDPPAPWQDHADRWTLPAAVALPPGDGSVPLAPLPTLAAIGSQAGIHLLLDLERLGFLTVHGDPDRAVDLLRYLAAELACNTWSDSTEVLLAGFDPGEAELLAAVNPDRVRVLPSVAEAVALLGHRIASVRATLGHAGAADTLAGRIRGVAGDAWLPQVLLAASPGPAELAALTALGQQLHGAARCAVAVATTDTAPPPPDRWRVTVTPDGVVHLRLPFLRASLSAATLSVEELVPLAETVRAARSASQAPVPPASETEPWAASTDAAGGLRPVGTAAVRSDWFPLVGTRPVTAGTVRVDPGLEEDLRAWHAAEPDRPRIGVLGPVSVDAPGTPPDLRRRLHAELIVYLADRAGRGADAQMIDEALWPDTRVTEPARQLTISRARRWLGTRPDGAPWLPDVGADLAYRLADGYLFDWHLFRRLRSRGESRGAAGADDLREALRLVRGAPLDGADRVRAPGTRNPYPWLPESDLHPDHLLATIVDTAHQLAELSLAAGDPAGARWAVRQAWLADTGRGYDQPWQDLLRAAHADGRTGELRAVLAELMELRDAEAPEDLSPDTYRLISHWPPNVLVPAG
jgi:nucleoid-associated protein YgaU